MGFSQIGRIEPDTLKKKTRTLVSNYGGNVDCRSAKTVRKDGGRRFFRRQAEQKSQPRKNLQRIAHARQTARFLHQKAGHAVRGFEKKEGQPRLLFCALSESGGSQPSGCAEIYKARQSEM